MENFGRYAVEVLSGNHDMSGVFNGNSVFSFLNTKDQYKTSENRMLWIIDSYFGNTDSKSEATDYYRSNCLDDFKVCEKRSEGTERMDAIKYMREYIGLLYNEFPNIYKKPDDTYHIEEYDYEDDDEAYDSDEYEEYEDYNDFCVEDYGSEEEY